MDDEPRKPFDPMPYIKRIGLPTALGVVLAIIYGFIMRAAINGILDGAGSLTIAFFCLTPPALGFLTVMLTPAERRTTALYAITAPWLSCVCCMIIAAVMTWEYAFCVILAMPLFLLLSSLGGCVAAVLWYVAKNSTGPRVGALVVVLALPYLSAAIERSFPPQTDVRRVQTVIEIAAPAEVVWGEITNLSEIPESARPAAFYHLIGLPRPIEAQMACQQVGCIRRGQWEDGLSFDGTITEITPGRSYWVSLKADTSGVKSALAPLKGIGGKAFDMVDDGYEIEPLGEGRSALRLTSTYRITSRINPYASLWLDLIMRDIQSSILGVEKARAEHIAAKGSDQ